VRLELAIEVIEHDAGLDHAAPACHIEIEDAIEIFRAVDHEGMVDGLAALRRSAAARSTVTPSARANAMARSASATDRGATTPSGIIW